MATQNPANELSRLIDKLHRERQHHVDELERIDTTFKQFGIDPEAPTSGKKRGRKKGSKKAGKKASRKKSTTRKKSGRRRRRTFDRTGEESVLTYVRSADHPTTAQVNEHWTNEGRGGKADNALSKLVKAGQISRNNIQGERGSYYTAT